MKNYLIKWPNETISVIEAANTDELLLILDYEGDPCDPSVFQIIGALHVTTDFEDGHLQADVEPDRCHLKQICWPPYPVKVAHEKVFSVRKKSANE